LGICIAQVPTQPYRAAQGTEIRVCYPGKPAASQPQWALTYCYLLQWETVNSKSEWKVDSLLHCSGLILWPSACQCSALTTQPCPTPVYVISKLL
jgi:hypothetical protein